jgi:uncharacterized protein YbjT (DUF2867 family)
MSEDRILLTGSSGLIGTSLVRSLMRKRISMVSLVRHPHRLRPDPVTRVSDPRFQ